MAATEITKTIIELHQLFDAATFRTHLLNSIKQLDGADDFDDLGSVLERNVYQIVKIGKAEHAVKELINNFNGYISRYLSNNFWTKLYIGIVEKLLSFHEPLYKEGLISDIYLILSNLNLDAKEIYDHHKYLLERYFEENGENVGEKFDFQIYLSPACINPFELAYYAKISEHLENLLVQLRIRFESYISEKVEASIREQIGKDRIVLAINLEDKDKKETPEENGLAWAGNISELAELAAALISTDSVKFNDSNDDEKDGKVGAYLFMLFDVQKNMTPDQYYRHINDIKQRNDKVVFMAQLKDALETYMEEGRKTVLKRRAKKRKLDKS